MLMMKIGYGGSWFIGHFSVVYRQIKGPITDLHSVHLPTIFEF
jgi:hypothetical protein